MENNIKKQRLKVFSRFLWLCRQLKMPQGSVSRNVKALSDYTERVNGVLVRKGHGLLKTEPDVYNPHSLAVYPTAKGKDTAAALVAEMGKERRSGGGVDGARNFAARVRFDAGSRT